MARKNENLRNYLLQLDISKPRERRIIKILETVKEEGISYKQFFTTLIENRNELDEFKQLIIKTSLQNTPEEKKN